MNDKILSLDFDGCVHLYSTPWQGARIIPDPPVPGALAFLREATQHFQVAIYSSRSNEPGGIAAMQNWLAYHAMHSTEIPDEDISFLELIQWPLIKPQAFVGLDDRILTFRGRWPTMQLLSDFKPWNR